MAPGLFQCSGPGRNENVQKLVSRTSVGTGDGNRVKILKCPYWGFIVIQSTIIVFCNQQTILLLIIILPTSLLYYL